EREVFELRLDGVASLDVRGKLRIDARQLSDPLPDAAQPGEHGLFAFVEGRVAFLAQPLNPICADEDLTQGGELVVFGRAWRDTPDFSELKRDQIEACSLLARVHPRALELVAKRPNRRPGVSNPRPEVCEVREVIEQWQMRERVEERLMLVLSVQLDQPGRQIAKRGRGGEGPVDEGSTPALGCDFPADHHFTALGGLEDGLDDRLGFTGADEILRRARA